MKLLLDENLPHTLATDIQRIFPESEHVRNVGLRGRTDWEIWEFARISGHVIVSKDFDFNERALLMGAPPRVIWLRIGNCTRQDIQKLLFESRETILAWESNLEEAVLELG
jgi:predicted nuclease of predicted toxin-antitoxin system